MLRYLLFVRRTLLKMKYLICALIYCLCYVSGYPQADPTQNLKSENSIESHEIIAIIPFSVRLILFPQDLKEISRPQLKEIERVLGNDVQLILYRWLMKREKQGILKVKVQDPKITRRKLEEAGILSENIKWHPPERLAELLEVDAIIKGRFQSRQVMSAGAAFAVNTMTNFWANTHKATIDLSIHQGINGALFYHYKKTISRSNGNGIHPLVNALMRKASRKFPYIKDL